MMPEHFSHKQMHIPCQSSCVGSQFLQAVGVAKGVQLAKRGEVVPEERTEEEEYALIQQGTPMGNELPVVDGEGTDDGDGE